MRASWNISNRRGVGALAAFVIWVVMIALIYAFMLGQGQSGALAGIVRVSGVRTVVFAGQSALAEASYQLRHPTSGTSTVLESIRTGSAGGNVMEPDGTRKLYEEDVQAGRLEIGTVQYAVASKPAKDRDPYQIDLTVRVTTKFAGTKITRLLRRRVLADLCQVRAMLGPSKGQVVLVSLALQGRPLFEVVEQ